MRFRTGLIFALAALVLLTTQAFADSGGRYALVIGNSAYKDKPLKNPANDARDMAKALQRLGFDVQLKTDASLREIEDAIRDFGVKLKRGGVGLFYFAGHGVQVQGVNYLVPVGAKIASESDAKYECVDAGRVLGKMEDAGNELNIVILDACRNNPFARSFRSADQGLARMDAPTGSMVAYSTAPNSVASDGKGTNGLYTKYLLENINTPGIPIEEVFKRVRIGVMSETAKKQVPWESSSIAGYFYLAGGQPQAGSTQAVAAQAAGQAAGQIAGQAAVAQTTLKQRQQEQKLKEYIAGLEAEKRQVEKERAELERRREQFDQDTAQRLKEAQAPQEQRLKEQLSVLEAERRKLEQERLDLAKAREQAQLAQQQAQQAQKLAQQQTQQQAQQQAQRQPQGSIGQVASADPRPQLPQQAPPRPRETDRSTILERLAGVWRFETDGNLPLPLLSLKPGGDTLYGTLLGDQRILDRVSLTGLAMEGGSLHVRLNVQPPPPRGFVDQRGRFRVAVRGQQQPTKVVECVGDLRQGNGEIPIICERVDAGAAPEGKRRQEYGRMVRTTASRFW